MLTRELLYERDGVALVAARCSPDDTRWTEPEVVARTAVVFMRRGWFRRRADGHDTLVDPSGVYVQRRGEEQQVADPTGAGFACSAIVLVEELVPAEWRERAPEHIRLTPKLALEQRLLAGRCAREPRSHELGDLALALVASLLGLTVPRRRRRTRQATAAAHARLVEAAREHLLADPATSVAALARSLAVSPHHLTRTFREITSQSVVQYRTSLRTHTALQRLADGERDLGRLATELGFSDHAHMTRVIRQQTETTPSALRDALAEEAA